MLSYFIVVVLLGAFAAAIMVRAFHTAFVEKDKWMKVAEGLKRPDHTIVPGRGNIYSCDGRLMATNVPYYRLYMDFRSRGFLPDTFLHAKNNGLDSLAVRLSRKLKDKTAADYRAYLLAGWKEKNPRLLVCSRPVSRTELKEIQQFPFLRLGRYKSGFFTEEMVRREKPFGSLASRTIGDIYGALEKNGTSRGKNGLELQYDSLLRGKPGLSSVLRVGGAWTNVTEIEPENGMDIRTTIDIRIQDITEKSLVDKLKEVDAESGTAVVMEVSTGEIKAITNMARIGKDWYAETKNHAVADEIEPGSTFKVASMMVALEDGVCRPGDTINVGDGVFPYAGERISDHNSNRGGYGRITAEQVIWYSSNVGIAKIILKGYRDHPEKFVEGLYRIGMNADLNPEIPGSGKAKIRMPDDKRSNWSRTALPWMSFGYETQIPPIHILTFFNAIANNGKMVRPLFSREIERNGKTVKRFSTGVVNSSICSSRTLKAIQSMLLNAVEDERGTGRPARSNSVRIAGKTGTAQIASGGSYYANGHHVSFCGYFPADHPQYSCIVVVRRPRSGNLSGGAVCGTVVKTIAEKVYAGATFRDVRKMEATLDASSLPPVKGGEAESVKRVLDYLDVKTGDAKPETEWVSASAEGNKITLKSLPLREGLIPHVTGLGAKDAVFLLEKAGLQVSLSGAGSVVSQSIPPGERVTKGQTIVLTLK